jgi:hypothetical protein
LHSAAPSFSQEVEGKIKLGVGASSAMQNVARLNRKHDADFV